MRTYGLIGFPLTHSFSSKYFADKFSREGIADCIYKNLPIESITEFPDLLKTEVLSGLNVTIPHKETVMKYLDGIDETARTIGAVNCIKFANGRSIGYNTDAYGFSESLRSFIGETKLKALILGTGGSSKAIAFALEQMDISYQLVTRSAKTNSITYDDLTEDIIANHKLIINTTPVGMFPEVHRVPALPFEYLTSHHYLFDLIYNPKKTEFLKLGTKRGTHTKNGLEMLQLQAEKSWDIWNRD